MLLEPNAVVATLAKNRTEIGWFDEAGRLIACTPAFGRRFGSGPQELAGRHVSELVSEISHDDWRRIWSGGEGGEGRLVLEWANHADEMSMGIDIHADRVDFGGTACCALTVQPAESAALHNRLNALQREILECVAARQPLTAIAERLCRRVEDLAPTVISSVLLVDGERTLRHLAGPSLTDAYCRAIDGTPIGPMVGSCGTAAYFGQSVEAADITIDPRWRDFLALALPLGLRACWSSPIKAQSGEVLGTFAFYYRTPRGPSDFHRRIVDTCVHLCAIAIEHERTQSRINQLAHFDQLTGLANRSAFKDQVGAVLAAGRPSTLFYMDLDDFKAVNDTMGHPAGDRLLADVASRMRAYLEPDDLLARLGGDEFAVLRPDSIDRAGATRFGELLVQAAGAPFLVEGRPVRIGVSVGIVSSPEDGETLDELLRRADLALYQAKRAGRGTIRFFDAELARRTTARKAMEADLRRAIDERQLAVVFQPILDMSSHAVAGCEALLRWHHPTQGAISPADFVPVAENAGLIGTIGRWVLREACSEATSWPQDMSVAVNLSPLQLACPSFAGDVLHILDETGLAPERLELEITESVLLEENSLTLDALRRLRHAGIRVSLDDFGTGFSSLSYLRTFPFDRIKIDRSFVKDIFEAGGSTAIVRAIVGLARDLGMTTVAEGVETTGQWLHLRELGCTHGQGYLFGRPQSAAAIAHLFFPKRQAAV